MKNEIFKTIAVTKYRSCGQLYYIPIENISHLRETNNAHGDNRPAAVFTKDGTEIEIEESAYKVIAMIKKVENAK